MQHNSKYRTTRYQEYAQEKKKYFSHSNSSSHIGTAAKHSVQSGKSSARSVGRPVGRKLTDWKYFLYGNTKFHRSRPLTWEAVH